MSGYVKHGPHVGSRVPSLSRQSPNQPPQFSMLDSLVPGEHLESQSFQNHLILRPNISTGRGRKFRSSVRCEGWCEMVHR